MWYRRLLRSSLALVALGFIAEVGLRVGLGLGNPVLSQHDQACGYLVTPCQDTTRFGAHNHINRYGMRSAEFSDTKPAGTFRILCLGDSVTYGTTFVDQSQIYTSKLEKSLADQHQKVEVLNASSGGWGPGNELGYLRSRGDFQADLVVFCLNPTDLTGDFANGELSLALGVPEHRPLLALQEFWVRYAVPRLSRFLSQPKSNTPEISNRNDLALGVPKMLREISQAKAFANHSGAAFAIIFTAAKQNDPELDTPSLRQAHDTLVVWTHENNVPLVDVSKAFAACDPQELYYDNIHIRALGHDIIAQAFCDQWTTLASAELIHTQREPMLAAR